MEGLIIAMLAPIFDAFYSAILPLLLAGLAGRLAVTLGVNDKAKKAELERILRDALHRSIGNGLSIALAPLRGLSEFDIKAKLQERPEILDTVMGYVERNNPDALKQFKLDRPRLGELLKVQLPDAMNRAALRQPHLGADAP